MPCQTCPRLFLIQANEKEGLRHGGTVAEEADLGLVFL
jgi:hypothetical protein